MKARALLQGGRRTNVVDSAISFVVTAAQVLRGSAALPKVHEAYVLLTDARMDAARDDEAEEIGRRRMNAELDARIAELDARADA